MKKALHAAGFDVSRLGSGTLLVQRHANGRRSVRDLGGDTFVVVPTGPDARRVRKVGKHLGAYVVTDPVVLRDHMPRFQRAMSAYLGTQQVLATLRALDVDLVLDVGANTGQFASSLRRNGYRGRIVSFEPLEEFAAQVREQAAGDALWTVHQCALGDEDGTAEINAMPGTMSSLLPSTQFGRDWAENLDKIEKRTIQVRRLDSVYDEVVGDQADPRVYLKLDTQGYDLRAFRGACDSIEHVVAMQSELSCVPIYEGMPGWAEQLAAFEVAGFEIAGMYEVSRDEPTLRVIEFDVVMVRPEAVRGPR